MSLICGRLARLTSTFHPRIFISRNFSSDERVPEDENELRKVILDASLPFVPLYGWTIKAIIAGAEEKGHPGIVHGLFTRGEVDLVVHFSESCNQQLANDLKRIAEEARVDPTKKKEPLIFVKDAIKARILMIAPYQKQWPQALGIMARPSNLTLAMTNLLSLVDNISYYAGDRSVDFNWYVHRMALAGIYKTTELYFTQDESENYRATWDFLTRRIEAAAMFQNSFQMAEKVASATFITIRNMMGASYVNR